MGLETFALINDKDQVVNHIVVDKEAPDFEEVMDGQLAHWNCVRYVETTEEQPVIILHQDDDIWTTHCDDAESENHGFTLPDAETYLKRIGAWVEPVTLIIEEKTVNGKKYPIDSKLLKSNAHLRPEGYEFPEGVTEVDDL